MSKNRPRTRLGAFRFRVDYWKNRVFRNTYTYKGRLARVRGWSVKIQYRCRRRTISLHSPRRAGAAREAARAYRTIVTRGWTALTSTRASQSSPAAKITIRERDILELIGIGCVDKEIAARLGISAWTVHDHMKKIFEKLNARTRTEAVIKYLQT